MLASTSLAHPELDTDGSGKPCSFLHSSAQEDALENAGEGYKQIPTRALLVDLRQWKQTSLNS
jgi:hypothetical protein